jgi:hypothetical protein
VETTRFLIRAAFGDVQQRNHDLAAVETNLFVDWYTDALLSQRNHQELAQRRK